MRVAAQQDPGRRGHPPPLRRLQQVLRVGARSVDDLHLRAATRTADATLEEAQENKYRLVFDKLRLQPGDRLLDVGCGWGGMVRYAARRGVRAIGVDAVGRAGRVGAEGDRGRGADRAGRGAALRLPRCPRDGLRRRLVDRAHRAYRRRTTIPSYFGFLKSKLRTGGLLLNHCITRPDNQYQVRRRPFHRPLRLPRRGGDWLGAHHHRDPGRPASRSCTRRTSVTTTR